jgi:hypothetical protein
MSPPALDRVVKPVWPKILTSASKTCMTFSCN